MKQRTGVQYMQIAASLKPEARGQRPRTSTTTLQPGAQELIQGLALACPVHAGTSAEECRDHRQDDRFELPGVSVEDMLLALKIEE